VIADCSTRPAFPAPTASGFSRTRCMTPIHP